MSERVSMVRLLHGLMYPTVARCHIDGCFLGRNLPGVRLETGAVMEFAVADDAMHALRSRLPEQEQRANLMEVMRADGRNVVRFDARGVMVVSRREP
ncbi:hypothetical protein SEA_JUSTBECAUSE_218 [Streptomyces phage JustBecause]|jgi:hypothetical protein|nr:hypothetical protein SEA_JUSTBECAUSE_218 [Streptomyces phage JustBecause]